MGTKQTQYFCNRCQKHTLHVCVGYDVPHIFHLLMTLFMCGFWLPIWLLHIVLNEFSGREPYRCTQCGQAAGEPTPEQQAVRNEELRAIAARQARQRSESRTRTKARITALGSSCVNAACATGRGFSGAVKRADGALEAMAGDDAFFHGFLRVMTVFVVGAAIAVCVAFLVLL